MIPLSISIGTDGDEEAMFTTALNTAVDNLANEALSPSSVAFVAAAEVLARAEPESQFEFGRSCAGAVHRAGEHVWILTSEEPYRALERMGAHVAMSAHDRVIEDLIDAAERRAAADSETPAEGSGVRDAAHDAHQLREVLDGRALADAPRALAILTEGPEMDFGPDDLADGVVQATTPGKIALSFLMTFARDFSAAPGDI